MKIAITGKGGVGKTTISSLFCRIFAAQNKQVLCIDADPDENLALALGFPDHIAENIQPISKMKDIIEQRTGTTLGGFGKMFKLNPKVDDFVDKFSKTHNNISILKIGTVPKGGSGCYCPENVILKKLISHLILEKDDTLIIDMEAGLEHFSRGVTGGVDAFIVVVEPGIRSIKTYYKIKEMAADLDVKTVFTIANKVRNDDDLKYIKNLVDEKFLLGSLSYNNNVIESDRKNLSPYDNASQSVDEVQKLIVKLNATLLGNPVEL